MRNLNLLVKSLALTLAGLVLGGFIGLCTDYREGYSKG